MFTLFPQIKIGDNIRDIPTPALILDFDSFVANLKKLPETLKQVNPNVQIRPHAKAHKCPLIAQLQVSSGAVGVCVQKLSEAEAMVAGGIRDVLISNEIVERHKLLRVAALSKYATITLCVDNRQIIKELGEIAQNANAHLNVLVEVNVGHDRCGVDPNDVVEYAKAVRAWAPYLHFRGIQCYHGRNQHIRKYSERKAAVVASAACARQAVTLLKNADIDCPIVTGGGTGTYLFEAMSGVYNEVQPGSYIFMDVDYSLNLDQNDQPVSDFKQSLFVLTTVMSDTNRNKGHFLSFFSLTVCVWVNGERKRHVKHAN
jgi:D-serine deaminase-like pyridoxal phosphate-dependent protein